jgi:hypothetical protein
MAVYGPVRHQKHIIWTEASKGHILPYDMNYLLYYAFYLK